MRKFSIALLVVAMCADAYAQMPQGGGGGFGGRGSGGFGSVERRESVSTSGSESSKPAKVESVVLENFPEIPALTAKQQKKVSNIMTSEQKDIRSLFNQKRELVKQEYDAQESGADKTDAEKTAKRQEKIAEIDGKIQKRIADSNSKVEKQLSAEQYQVFLKKRDEFRFSVQQSSKDTTDDTDSFDDRSRISPAQSGNSGYRR
ncbi:MAG: hypothetical protein LBR06_03565 [Bacteroidales bacterium]|nr:hypothetical protein [Bacteroidales bacterium]